MANRFNNITTILATSDSAMVASTLTLFAPIIPTDQVICGMLHMQAKLTAGSVNQSFTVYALYSEDGTNFDESNVANIKYVGVINLINDTGTYHFYSMPIDGLSTAGKYMKIALLPASASAGTIAANTLKVVTRSPK